MFDKIISWFTRGDTKTVSHMDTLVEPSAIEKSLNSIKYWVTESCGKKKIGFSYDYEPEIKLGDMQSIIEKEFSNTPVSKLLIRSEGTAWYFGGGSFHFTITEIE